MSFISGFPNVLNIHKYIAERDHVHQFHVETTSKNIACNESDSKVQYTRKENSILFHRKVNVNFNWEGASQGIWLVSGRNRDSGVERCK